MGFIPRMQSCFNIPKSTDVIWHVNRIKDKNYKTISTDTEKAFNRIQYPFMRKMFNKPGTEGEIPKLDKWHL